MVARLVRMIMVAQYGNEFRHSFISSAAIAGKERICRVPQVLLMSSPHQLRTSRKKLPPDINVTVRIVHHIHNFEGHLLSEAQQISLFLSPVNSMMKGKWMNKDMRFMWPCFKVVLHYFCPLGIVPKQVMCPAV